MAVVPHLLFPQNTTQIRTFPEQSEKSPTWLGNKKILSILRSMLRAFLSRYPISHFSFEKTNHKALALWFVGGDKWDRTADLPKMR